jgi:hypothetical protein
MSFLGGHRLPKLPDTPLQGAQKMGVAPQPLTAPAALIYVPAQVPPLRVTPPVMPPLPAVPQRVMPPLPAIPPAPWAASRNPSANMVQQQYVGLRLEEMEVNRQPGRKAALDMLEQMLLDKLDPNKKQKIPFKQLMRVYNEIERNLQSAELTINFKADVWFTAENPFDSYTQMYERAMEGNKMVLRSTAMNDATARAEVDNQITFPDNWQNAQSGPARGLSPGRQGADRIMRQMDTGQLAPVGAPKDRAFHAGNSHFNPQTKQIFLALNYGRRPHGSAMNFGKSYLVFNDSLKKNCLYYGGDTFMHRGQESHAGTIQYAYDNLGAILGSIHGGAMMLRSEIFKACYEGQILADPFDTSLCKFYLLEAHHFGELKFAEHAEYLVISPDGVTDKSLWPQIVENARKFCARLRIKLYQTS